MIVFELLELCTQLVVTEILGILNTSTVDLENDCSRRINFTLSSFRKHFYEKTLLILEIVFLS